MSMWKVCIVREQDWAKRLEGLHVIENVKYSYAHFPKVKNHKQADSPQEKQS